MRNALLTHSQGVSRPNDLRQSAPKPYWEYFVTLIPQSVCNHRVHLLFSTSSSSPVPISLPPKTEKYGPQRSYETENPVPLDSFGPTTLAPLGFVALSRSGDKASDANIGLFVRRDDEYAWLCSLLTIPKFKELLGGDWRGGRIDRYVLSLHPCEVESRILEFANFVMQIRNEKSAGGAFLDQEPLGSWLQ